MVRLKSLAFGAFGTLISLFQFHYGSIKIADFKHDALCKEVFQFHYGSIKIK